MAKITKSNNVRTGWAKVLDVNGEPKPIFQPTFINGRFDKAQVWMRSVILEGSTLKGWYTGDNGTPTFVYKIGYATSVDYGDTWTRYSTSEIYADATLTAGRGIVMARVLFDADLNKYLMFYCGIDPNVTGFHIAESTDGITSWSKTHTGLLAGTNIGYVGECFKQGGVYYIYIQKNFQTGSNFGPARELHLYQSTDLSTWTSLGAKLVIKGSNEFGVGPDSATLQKPNGEYFLLHACAKNRTQALASGTKEASSFIKVAESTVKIQNSAPAYEYPDNVSFHAPLGSETGIVDVISNVGGSLSSGNFSWAEYQMIRLSGSQVLTFTNNGSVIEGEHFGVKMRVQILTTGTHELFRIGNDIIMSLVSGKLRVQLSSSGSGYEKDYITSVNISKPTGLDYIDDHIYVGFIWDGATLTLFNDFVPFTSGQVTETVDTALATVNNSSANILIGQNATLDLRSVSVMIEPTQAEFIALEL
jgi:hypothetical protein